MNPFGITGVEAVVCTSLVCATVGVLAWKFLGVTAEAIDRICTAAEDYVQTLKK